MIDRDDFWLIGIDDTDNLESRGTGYIARCLGSRIAAEGLGAMRGISRHQLLVSPQIPYTSHNSSACLGVELHAGGVEALVTLCREFLLSNAADGSDAGLCVAEARSVGDPVIDFGRRAQREVLQMQEAVGLAASASIHLEGLTGDRGGVIGALSATGLRAAGEDGRFIWVAGVRERKNTRCRLEELLRATGVEAVETVDGTAIDDPSLVVDLGPWPRPIARGGRAVLLVEEGDESSDPAWRVVDRAIIKRY